MRCNKFGRLATFQGVFGSAKSEPARSAPYQLDRAMPIVFQNFFSRLTQPATVKSSWVAPAGSQSFLRSTVS